MSNAIVCPSIQVSVQKQAFDPGSSYHLFKQTLSCSGAIIQFIGIVRADAVEGGLVEHLELEHYPGMTESAIATICEQAVDRWGLEGVSVIHRVGKLKAGDEIVLVQAGGAHRQAALDAVAFIMDYLKNDVPLWKKQSVAGVETWVDQKESDKSRKKLWQ